MKEKFVINSGIIFLNSTYMAVTTSFFLNCLEFKFDTRANTLCSLFTVLLGLISFGLPIFVGVFYSCNHQKILWDEKFKGKWCKLVEELNFKRNGKSVLLLPVCSLIRKLILAATCVFL